MCFGFTFPIVLTFFFSHLSWMLVFFLVLVIGSMFISCSTSFLDLGCYRCHGNLIVLLFLFFFFLFFSCLGPPDGRLVNFLRLRLDIPSMLRPSIYLRQTTLICTSMDMTPLQLLVHSMNEPCASAYPVFCLPTNKFSNVTEVPTLFISHFRLSLTSSTSLFGCLQPFVVVLGIRLPAPLNSTELFILSSYPV